MLQNNGNYSSKITRRRFREFLHDNLDLSEEIIMDRIFKYFNTETADDIDLEEWIVGFNVLLKGGHFLTSFDKVGLTCNRKTEFRIKISLSFENILS